MRLIKVSWDGAGKLCGLVPQVALEGPCDATYPGGPTWRAGKFRFSSDLLRAVSQRTHMWVRGKAL